jgi:site-specific recombinase XerD
MTENTIVNFTDTATGWQKVFYAFLAEKEQRSGSRRTVEGYSRMLQDFFGRSGKQPDNVTSQDIFVYAHSPGLSGKQPSAITIGARIACVSSFFRFLIRMDIVQSNSCDKLQRPQTSPSTPRGLSGDQVHQLLAVVPDSPVGLRDRAIILTLVLTGRRRAEVIGMKAGNLILDGGRAYYTYRGKGGIQGHRELPQPALNAIRASLAAFGKDLATMPPKMSHYGRHYRTIVTESPAEHSTATCRDISKRLASPPREYISSAILQPSCAGMPEKLWKMSAVFWTTAVWQ